MQVITSGLTAGDRIVAGDLWRVAPGQTITPQLTTIE